MDLIQLSMNLISLACLSISFWMILSMSMFRASLSICLLLQIIIQACKGINFIDCINLFPMLFTKSEPKLKFSINSIDNFLTEKNFKDEMYMDQEEEERLRIQQQLQRKKSLSTIIKPRSKLTYSIHERVDSVLTNNSKVGMLQKDSNKKSIAKISHTSTLPPIKTQQKQSTDYLVKMKNQLNQTSNKVIKLQKQISQLKGSTKQLHEKVIFYNSYLNPNLEKDEWIKGASQQIAWIKYENDVLKNMRDNLKHINITMGKQKLNKEKKLNEIKQNHQSIADSLERLNYELSHNLKTKQVYHKKQQQSSNDFMMKSQVASNKVTEEHRAHALRMKYANEETYIEDKYIQETTMNNHIEGMSKYRAQYALCQMMESLLLKYKSQFGECDKAATLMEMYSIRHFIKEKQPQLKLSMKSSKSQIKQSTRTLTNSTKSFKVGSDFDVVTAYYQSFSTKKQLEENIKDYEQKIKRLEKKHEELFTKWVDMTFIDKLTQGNQTEKKKTDFSEDIKDLYKRQKAVGENKHKMERIKYWIKKQQEKLGIKISKKSKAPQYIQAILKHVLAQAKKYAK